MLERLADLERAVRYLGCGILGCENGDVQAFVRVCERIDDGEVHREPVDLAEEREGGRQKQG